MAWPKIIHYQRDCQRCAIWFRSDKNICLLLLPSVDDLSKLAPSVMLLELSTIHPAGSLLQCVAKHWSPWDFFHMAKAARGGAGEGGTSIIHCVNVQLHCPASLFMVPAKMGSFHLTVKYIFLLLGCVQMDTCCGTGMYRPHGQLDVSHNLSISRLTGKLAKKLFPCYPALLYLFLLIH